MQHSFSPECSSVPWLFCCFQYSVQSLCVTETQVQCRPWTQHLAMFSALRGADYENGRGGGRREGVEINHCGRVQRIYQLLPNSISFSLSCLLNKVHQSFHPLMCHIKPRIFLWSWYVELPDKPWDQHKAVVTNLLSLATHQTHQIHSQVNLTLVWQISQQHMCTAGWTTNHWDIGMTNPGATEQQII